MSDNIIDNTFMSKNNLTFPQYNQDTKITRDRKSSKCNLSEISYDLNWSSVRWWKFSVHLIIETPMTSKPILVKRKHSAAFLYDWRRDVVCTTHRFEIDVSKPWTDVVNSSSLNPPQRKVITRYHLDSSVTQRNSACITVKNFPKQSHFVALTLTERSEVGNITQHFS